ALALVEGCAVNGWIKHSLWVVAVVTLIGGLCSAPLLSQDRTPTAAARAAPAVPPTAPDLVRQVRAGQEWVGPVKSLSVRVEGTWRTTPGRKGLDQTIEIAFAGRRLRHAYASKGFGESVSVWDGRHATKWYRYDVADQDNVILSARREDVGEALWEN